MRTQLGKAAVIMLLVGAGGCVRRTMTIRTEPVSGARVFLNDEDVRFLDNLDTSVKDGDELSIVPAIAGGV